MPEYAVTKAMKALLETTNNSNSNSWYGDIVGMHRL